MDKLLDKLSEIHAVLSLASNVLDTPCTAGEEEQARYAIRMAKDSLYRIFVDLKTQQIERTARIEEV